MMFCKYDGPVTFLLYDFFNDVDIQLVPEFKNKLGKYVLKIRKDFFGDMLYIIKHGSQRTLPNCVVEFIHNFSKL